MTAHDLILEPTAPDAATAGMRCMHCNAELLEAERNIWWTTYQGTRHVDPHTCIRALLSELAGLRADGERVAKMRRAIENACGIIEIGDQRLLASDGPVSGMPPDISLEEWREMYTALNAARRAP